MPDIVTPTTDREPEPRWPAAFTVFAAVALHFSLPPAFRVGPPWAGAGVIVFLVLLSAFAARLGYERLNQALGYLVAAALTVAVLYGVARLAAGLVQHLETPAALLRSAAILWVTNVVTFAVWYWRLDAGGPNERDRQRRATVGAFLFPQLALPTDMARRDTESESWRPHFVDYLFLSFNTSTAFSPTDVPVLGRWAKVLMMVQATLSFTTIVVLVARAINTL